MKSMVRKKFAAAVWFVCMFMLLLGCTAKNIQSEEQFAAVELIENNINSPDDGEEAELFNEGHTLTAHYLDVGQGDSIFIELPNSETMLIDAGNPGNENIISA